MLLPSVTNKSLFNDLFDGFDDFFMRPMNQYKPVHEAKAYGLMKTDIKENEKDFEISIGNIIDDRKVQDWAEYEKYDIVAANILHNVLDILTPVILKQLKPGGIYITSGIIDEKEGFMLDVMKRDGLEVLEVTRQGEWVSITARKPE